MKKLVQISALIIAFVFSAISVNAQDIITAKDFSTAIKDKNTVVISAQKSKDYGVSHIKGAINVVHTKLYKDAEPKGMLKSPEELAKQLGELGISDKNQIIIYDGDKNKYASRVYWILKYLGAPNVKILEKDMKAWRGARVPLTKAPAKGTPTTFTPQVNKDIIADMAFVKAHMNDPKVIIVDSRDAQEFAGAKDDSPGHIKGAVNLNWEALVTDQGVFKDKATLISLLKSAGITADKTAVFYCTTSVRAGALFFVTKSILGYPNVKIYDGAINEWSAASNPIEK